MGPVELSIETVILGDLAAEVGWLLAPEARRRKIRLVLRAPPAPIILSSDRRLLRHALVVLVENAIEVCREEGLVELVWMREADGEVIIVVDDEGPGIEPDLLKTVFDPGRSEIDAPYVGETGGPGDGLPAAKCNVDALGGTLTAESEPDFGSRFTIRLPVGRRRAI